MRNLAITSLLASLDEAYDRRSWHGTNLRGSLRGLSAAIAAWRPGQGRHNAWEITLHAAYWKYAAWRRISALSSEVATMMTAFLIPSSPR